MTVKSKVHAALFIHFSVVNHCQIESKYEIESFVSFGHVLSNAFFERERMFRFQRIATRIKSNLRTESNLFSTSSKRCRIESLSLSLRVSLTALQILWRYVGKKISDIFLMK